MGNFLREEIMSDSHQIATTGYLFTNEHFTERKEVVKDELKLLNLEQLKQHFLSLKAPPIE